MPPSSLLPRFQSLPLLLTCRLCPFRCCPGADIWVGGLVYVVRSCSPSNKLSCDTGSFSHCCNPNRFLQPEVLNLYFPMLEHWVVWSVSLPSCSSLSACECGTAWSASCHLVTHPLYSGCPSPLPSVWMNVSSLTLWLSDIHAVFLSVLVVFCF